MLLSGSNQLLQFHIPCLIPIYLCTHVCASTVYKCFEQRLTHQHAIKRD